jgi:hypothetical protein
MRVASLTADVEAQRFTIDTVVRSFVRPRRLLGRLSVVSTAAGMETPQTRVSARRPESCARSAVRMLGSRRARLARASAAAHMLPLTKACAMTCAATDEAISAYSALMDRVKQRTESAANASDAPELPGDASAPSPRSGSRRCPAHEARGPVHLRRTASTEAALALLRFPRVLKAPTVLLYARGSDSFGASVEAALRAMGLSSVTRAPSSRPVPVQRCGAVPSNASA